METLDYCEKYLKYFGSIFCWDGDAVCSGMSVSQVLHHGGVFMTHLLF